MKIRDLRPITLIEDNSCQSLRFRVFRVSAVPVLRAVSSSGGANSISLARRSNRATSIRRSRRSARCSRVRAIPRLHQIRTALWPRISKLSGRSCNRGTWPGRRRRLLSLRKMPRRLRRHRAPRGHIAATVIIMWIPIPMLVRRRVRAAPVRPRIAAQLPVAS
jgi:hypothetical protein